MTRFRDELMDKLDKLRWRARRSPHRPEHLTLSRADAVIGPTGIGGAGQDELEPIALKFFTGLVSDLFTALRDVSVFDVLKIGGESVNQLADEIVAGSARLAALNRERQLQVTIANTQVQDWNLVFANWRVDGQASVLGNDLKKRLSDLGQEVEDLRRGGRRRRAATSDKILAFSASDASSPWTPSMVSTACRPRTTGIVGSRLPSPHLLAEEKGAARLEARSEELAREGLLSEPLSLSFRAVTSPSAATRSSSSTSAAVAAGDRLLWRELNPVERPRVVVPDGRSAGRRRQRARTRARTGIRDPPDSDARRKRQAERATLREAIKTAGIEVMKRSGRTRGDRSLRQGWLGASRGMERLHREDHHGGSCGVRRRALPVTSRATAVGGRAAPLGGTVP